MEEFKLYDGRVLLRYDDAKHKYVAVEEDGSVINAPSITTVLGVINKPMLMQWAVNQAINHLQSRLFDGGEFSELDISLFLEEAKYAHRAVKEKAGSIGTAAHNWLEGYWHQKIHASASGETFALPPLPEDSQVRNCAEAAIKWMAEYDIKPLLIEKPVYSRIYQVAGRMDKLAWINGVLTVVDWKSSSAIYPEYRFQISAYLFIYEEETGQRVEGAWLVRLGKHDGEFEAKYFSRAELEPDWQAFIAALTLYRRKQVLDRKR